MQRLITILLFLVGAANVAADAENKIREMRMDAAKEALASIELGYVDVPADQLIYLRVMAKHIFKSDGSFLFNMPESVVLSNYPNQVGFQAGRLISYCSGGSTSEEPSKAENVKESDIDALCKVASKCLSDNL